MAAINLLLLSCFAVFTSIISAVTGMGGGIVLLSLMTFILPAQIIIPIHGMVQLISNSYRCWLLRTDIKVNFLIYFLIGIPFGLLPSILLIEGSVQRPHIFQFIIATMILFVIFKPKRLGSFQLPAKFFFFLGSGAAFLGLWVGAVGPFIAPFFIRKDFTKKNIVATKSSMQTLIHLSKVPSFLYLGFNYWQHIETISALTISAIAGTFIGVKALEKIPENYFRIIFKTVLLLAALRLYYKALGVLL